MVKVSVKVNVGFSVFPVGEANKGCVPYAGGVPTL